MDLASDCHTIRSWKIQLEMEVLVEKIIYKWRMFPLPFWSHPSGGPNFIIQMGYEKYPKAHPIVLAG